MFVKAVKPNYMSLLSEAHRGWRGAGKLAPSYHRERPENKEEWDWVDGTQVRGSQVTQERSEHRTQETIGRYSSATLRGSGENVINIFPRLSSMGLARAEASQLLICYHYSNN